MNETQMQTRDRINQEIRHGRLRLDSTPCPICHGADFDKISEKDRFGINLSLVICRSCGLIHLNPRLTDESYAIFYDNHYNGIHLGSELDDEWYRGRYAKGKEIFSFLEANGFIDVLRERRALEVGCAAGGIIHHFQDRGFEVKGIDLSSVRVNYGIENHGLDLHHGGLQGMKLDSKPDLIIYSHVLEHVPDLASELEAVHENLADDGLVYIEVPGIKDLDRQHVDLLKALQLAHVYYFSLRSLQNLMEKNGFEMLYGDEQIRSVFRKTKNNVPSEVTVNDYGSAVDYLRYLESPLNKALLLSRNHTLRLLEAAKLLPILQEAGRKF